VLRTGSDRAYRRLGFAGGERHVVREDLAPAPAPGAARRSLLHLAHLSDLQIVDVQSPARMEFLELFPDRGALHSFLPAHRPYEALAVHAVDAVVRTLRALGPSPVTGAPVQLAVTTGDVVDNLQWNELQWFLSLMDGGSVRAGSVASEGVQTTAWGLPGYWHPDARADPYGERWGFPAYPGLLREAVEAFAASGLGIPWLACFGNHEALVQGMALASPAAAELIVGGRKPVALPPGVDPADPAVVAAFIRDPGPLLSGPTRAVAADATRRFFTRREFVQTHLRSPGSPAGHGFTNENLEHGTLYYAHDPVPGVRILVLDTSNPGGDADGSLGARQVAWLERRLIDAHATYLDAWGAPVRTGNEDRYVLLASHHGLETLGSGIVADGVDPETADLPRVLGPEIRALLHRFPNVVAWLNGHVHEHHLVPRPDPAGRTSGFWEITTGSIMDWPVQGRLVELVEDGDGSLSLLCTVVDHAAPPEPSAADDAWRLASVHRELAANDPFLGDDTGRRGAPSDRNAELRWRRR
jgi:metallophosphoesterase (TIGR03767 family)